MPVKVIRGNVGNAGNMWMKIHYGLQLEGTYLKNSGGIILCFKGLRCIRIANVSANMRIFVLFLKDLSDKRYCGCLSVGSGYCAKLSFAGLVCQLDLTPDRNLCRIKHLYKRLVQRYSRTYNRKIHLYEIRRFQLSRNYRNICFFIKIFQELKLIKLRI